MLALIEEERLRCPGCGQSRDLSMAPETQGQWVADAYRCHACHARAHKEEAMSGGKSDMAGMYFPLRLPDGFRLSDGPAADGTGAGG